MSTKVIRTLSILGLLLGIGTVVLGIVAYAQPVVYTTNPPPRTAQEQANYGATLGMLNSLMDTMGLAIIGIGALFTLFGIALVFAAWMQPRTPGAADPEAARQPTQV